ncbi:MAG: hypothetical protein M1825_003225 [Sarcosagium campestre]|nr:MAG: hypothetical protein M1825_003225 [Sarcosagium campestre]
MDNIPKPTSTAEALAALTETYRSLNPRTITELDCTPTPLEFQRYVSLNQPFVIRGGASEFPAVEKWRRPGYLRQRMSGRNVNVAVTPFGNADAVVHDPKDGILRQVQPLEVQEPFTNFLSYVVAQEERLGYQGCDTSQKGSLVEDAIKYAQTQYTPLLSDVPASIPWAHGVLNAGNGPDAVNFWLGNSRSTTALHRDPYENVYVQVVGEKEFMLLSPVESAWIGERWARKARYARDVSGGGWSIVDDVVGDDDQDRGHVPVPAWEPGAGRGEGEEEREGVLRISLHEGDVLYLPALW